MNTYKLHCFKESGNAYKVAVALSIVGLAWDKVVVDYFGGETRLPAWRAEVNELGEVPVLEVDGRKLTQSGSILLHLAEHVSAWRLTEEERPEVLRWLLFDNHKFTANLATYRWLRTFATPAPHEAVLAFMHQRIASALAIVERHLGAQRYIVGDRLTIADLSLAGYVFYPEEELGFDFSTDYPNVFAWMGRIAQTPGWQAPYDLLG
jgi:glutathione S-transferase